MNNNNQEKTQIAKNTLDLMKRFDEFGHTDLSIKELYQLLMRLFEIILSTENETREFKERAIKMLANSLGYGVSFTDLSPSVQKPKVAAKYRNPKNYNETWTGRGCTPVWVQNHLDSGGKKEELKIIK
jgi:DNA-binding protein H-NS